MPKGKTQNYHLNQWEKTDQVLMEDFNADNLAIDAAIKAEETARTAAISSLNTALAKYGNCQMWVYTYTGNGKSGESSQNSVTFPQKPGLIFMIGETAKIFQVLTPGFEAVTFNGYGVFFTWSGNTMSFYSAAASSQLNTSGRTYKVIAFWTK